MQQFLEILFLVEFSHECPDFPKIYVLKLFIKENILYIEIY